MDFRGFRSLITPLLLKTPRTTQPDSPRRYLQTRNGLSVLHHHLTYIAGRAQSPRQTTPTLATLSGMQLNILSPDGLKCVRSDYQPASPTSGFPTRLFYGSRHCHFRNFPRPVVVRESASRQIPAGDDWDLSSALTPERFQIDGSWRNCQSLAKRTSSRCHVLSHMVKVALRSHLPSLDALYFVYLRLRAFFAFFVFIHRSRYELFDMYLSLETIASWPAPNYKDPLRRGPSITIIYVVFYALVFGVVSLRTFTRLQISRSFGWDDAFILLAMACSTPHAVPTDNISDIME